MIPIGIRIYGLAAIALGVIGIVWDDFALVWEPVPAGFPGRGALAYLFAALLVVAGAATVWRRSSAAVGALGLCALHGIAVVLMHGAQIVQHPLAFAAWGGAAEQLALVLGGVAAYWHVTLPGVAHGDPVPATVAADTGLGGAGEAPSDHRNKAHHPALVEAPGRRRLLLTLMGVCLVSFGAFHFVYFEPTAGMVPKWIPGGQPFWAVATGVAHLAAAAAFFTGIQTRLAAILLTVMFAAFSALVHIPLLIADPHSHMHWVMNAVNLALTGAVWSIAEYLGQERTSHQSAGLIAGDGGVGAVRNYL
jgi:uncharacterized membrane protein